MMEENARKAKDSIKEWSDIIEKQGRSFVQKSHMQHGNTTVFEHSVNVAVDSVMLAEKLGIKVDLAKLIRGALLHDYFLYDWHQKDKSHSWHGFRHADAALKNAKEDFELSFIEENIIERHMFPLNPKPPACREAWIVCIADKYCAIKEIIGL